MSVALGLLAALAFAAGTAWAGLALAVFGVIVLAGGPSTPSKVDAVGNGREAARRP